jgi:hypothetical protein
MAIRVCVAGATGWTGVPALGSVSLAELAAVRGRMGLPNGAPEQENHLVARWGPVSRNVANKERFASGRRSCADAGDLDRGS